MDTRLMVWAGERGALIGLIGEANARASVVVKQFVDRSLEAGMDRVEIDLCECSGLDSTFLGCLVRLAQRAGAGFAVVCPSEAVTKVLRMTQLDHILPITDKPLSHLQETATTLPLADDNDPLVLGRHILHCHQALLAIDGPHRPACEAVVRNLAAGLGLEDEIG